MAAGPRTASLSVRASPDGALDAQKGKQMDMNCHPTTSGNSQLLRGEFWGVSEPNRNQKSLTLPVFPARFRIRPGEPVISISYNSIIP